MAEKDTRGQEPGEAQGRPDGKTNMENRPPWFAEGMTSPDSTQVPLEATTAEPDPNASGSGASTSSTGAGRDASNDSRKR